MRRVLNIYPKGDSFGTREYLSLFLELKNCAANRTVYATYTIKILDQLHNRHHQITGILLFFIILLILVDLFLIH
jgi:hypothetical protein